MPRKTHALENATRILAIVLFLCAMLTALRAWAGPLQRDILELEKHIIEDSSDTQAMLHLARLYIVTGDHEDARALLERVLVQRPDDADVLTELGFLDQVSGKTADARAFYMKALARDPEHPVASMNLGLSYLQTGEKDNAAAALKAAIQTNTKLLETLRDARPSGPDALRDYNNLQVHYLSNLALCHRGLGQPHIALKMLQEAKLLAPSDRVIEAGIATVQQEIAASPQSSSSKLVTAEQLGAMKAHPAAAPAQYAAVPPVPAQVRESVIRRDQPVAFAPVAPDARPDTDAAQNEREMAPAPVDEPQAPTQPQATDRTFPVEPPEQSVSVAPQEPLAAQIPPDAEPEQVEASTPQQPDAPPSPVSAGEFQKHLDAGNTALARGDYRAAATELERAAQLKPEHAQTHFLLAGAYRGNGQNEHALRAAKMAAEFDAENAGAQLLLAELEAIDGRGRDAEARVSAILTKEPVSAAAHISFCNVLLESDQEVRALAFARKWLDGSPASADAAACLIRAQRAREKIFDAAQTLKSALEHNPADPQLLALKTLVVQDARANQIAIPDLPGADDASMKTVRIGMDGSGDHPLADFPAYGRPALPMEEARLDVISGSSVSPRRQPIPVPPSLTEEIKEQISAFQADAYLAPPDFGFDWETLYALRSKLKGRWIFQHTDGRIYLMDAGNRPGRALAAGQHPSISADGEALVYVSGGHSGHAVHVLNLKTHATEKLLDAARMKQSSKAYFRTPSLSPNRKYLSVLSNTGAGVYELVILDTINDSLMRPLPGQNVFAAAWDASGRNVFFSVDPCMKSESGARQCLGTFNLDHGRVTWFDATVPSTDGARVPIGNVKSMVPVLSPSGKQLLVYSAESYIGAAAVLDLETREARRLDPRDINGARVSASGLGWAPDGSRLVFIRNNDLWVMDADGKNAFPAEQNLGALAPVLWRP